MERFWIIWRQKNWGDGEYLLRQNKKSYERDAIE